MTVIRSKVATYIQIVGVLLVLEVHVDQLTGAGTQTLAGS